MTKQQTTPINLFDISAEIHTCSFLNEVVEDILCRFIFTISCENAASVIQAQSFYMKILSINDFTTKLLSKLYTGVHLKGTKKFVNKVINRHFIHRNTVFLYVNIV